MSKFMEKWDYDKQVDFVEQVEQKLGIEILPFDNTNGVLELKVESNELPPCMVPVILTGKMGNAISTSFSNVVNSKTIELLPDERQKRQILSVDNDLDAPSTKDGHGDAFWSVGLAVMEIEKAEGKTSAFKDLKERNQKIKKRMNTDVDYCD